MAHTPTDYMIGCQVRKCRQPAYIGVYGIGVCEAHWKRICKEEGPVSDALVPLVPRDRRRVIEEARANTPLLTR
jgi:hypothetical protein